MSGTIKNVCVRCGKERIVAKTWVEELETLGGRSKLTRTLMVCPDSTCQAALEKELDKQRSAREAKIRAKEKQDEDRLAQRQAQRSDSSQQAASKS